VQAESLSQIADELYGLVPAEFTAARDERAKQARAAGERDTAAEIKKLARPTSGAWLVNQLVRGSAGQMDKLFAVGQALQDAQRELDGDRLRELSGQRRQIVAELVPEAARLAKAAGQPASGAVLDEVRSTLEAALADPAAGSAVRSGRLTRALAYAGLGEVDLTAAMAVLPATPAGAGGKEPAAARGRPSRSRAAGRAGSADEPGSTAADGPDGPGAQAAAAQLAVEEAEGDAEAAGAAMAEAERLAAEIVERRQFLRRRIENLQGELDEATTENARLGRESKQAQRDLDAAARKLAAAQRRLAKARERAASS
jgi:hypothetical protein